MSTRFISPALPGCRRRRHSDAFKSEVVDACRRPGVSIAAVALANGLNANLVRRWMVEAGCAASTKAICIEASEQETAVTAPQVASSFTGMNASRMRVARIFASRSTATAL